MTIIAVFSDDFILQSIWQNAIVEHLKNILPELNIIYGYEDWPATPLQFDNELKEFVGNQKDVAELVENADVVITHVAPIHRKTIDQAKNLKIIGCCRGGPVNVNINAATDRGIPVVYTPGRNAQAVVEFTLGLILSECKSISRAHTALSRGVWRGDLYRYDKAPHELQGRTIGLIGFGTIARMLVPYLKPFEMKILSYDPYVSEDIFKSYGVTSTDFYDLLKNSDIVSMHARVTKETLGMMGNKEFNTMKQGAFFINTARGALVDYDALYQVLKSGHLAGAGIDTFGIEPPPLNWPLLDLENVTLTPHIGGSSRETAHRSANMIAREVSNFFKGEPLQFCINPQVLEKK